MIEAHAPVERIRTAYNLISAFYGCCVAPLEAKARMRGLDLAAIRPGERVLEVAVGPGVTTVEIARRVGSSTKVHGLDLSPGMLDRARARLRSERIDHVDLREGDARRLPFPDKSFDVLYNSYMLDLIPLAELSPVLAEFRRVLTPGGRLALVNLSKRDEQDRTWLERLYSALPTRAVPFLLGGCRPVVMDRLVRNAGFDVGTREYLAWPIPSEIVVARRG